MGGADRRTLRGVGTYLIDAPKDSASTLRQRFLSFQEQHRGVVKSQTEILPDIPFRLNPKPESPPVPPVADTKPVTTITVDMATSPIFPYDEDLNLSPVGTASPDLSCTLGCTFLTDREMTMSVKDLADEVASFNIKDPSSDAIVTSRQPRNVTAEEAMSQDIKQIVKDIPEVKVIRRVIKERPRPSIVEPLARSVSFSERPRRRTPLKRYRDVPRFGLLPSTTPTTTSTGMVKVQDPPKPMVTSLFPRHPDTARPFSKPEESPRKRRSSSISDLTEVGSIFSWHDKEFERRTAQSVDMDSDNVGPTSFFQMKKSKSLLDLLKTSRRDDPNCKASELNAFCQKHRQSHMDFKKGSSFRRNISQEFEEIDKGWKDIVNTQVIDDAEYEKFASRRKPATPSTKKRPKITSPRGHRELRCSQTDSGKLYPMFVNVGSQAKKFGRALHHNRKLLKSK
ncbi:uncharacterized protein LOC143287856 [Babylonia areolata]|uniref:uncharacterized protein LOC143287856 n=1 Tax=Babylonia areolata TaxID=304850 RepID=UPI003FD1DC4F